MRRTWIIRSAVALHLLWAVLLIRAGTTVTQWHPEEVTALHDTCLMLPGPPWLEGVLLVLIAVAAEAGTRVYGPSRWRLYVGVALLLPQQAVLFGSAAGAILAACAGQFPNKIVATWDFLLADQAAYIFLALFHTAAIAEGVLGWHPKPGPSSPPPS